MGLICYCGLVDFALVVAILCFLVVFSVRRRYRYFEERGFPSLKPTFLLGSNFDLFLRMTTFTESMTELYHRLHPFDVGGYFQVVTPLLMVRSPRLLESILVKDFSHFHDHGFHFDADLDPLEAHLFNQEGVRWRALRNKLSPVFTTGRLRSMAPQMNRITDRLVDLLRTKSDSEVDVRNLVSRFAIDVIASCAFCLDSGALENPDCQFKRMADTIFRPRRYADSVKPLVRAFLPSVARLLGIRALPGDVVQFFTEVTTRAFQHRLKEGTVRNDFVDLLLELKIRGDAICEGTETEPQQKRLVFTDQLLAAQSFIFLGAGWETVSTAMALTLYFMGRHPEAQEEARRSVKKAKAAYGEIGFEAVKSMDYLDHCIAETMRLYPPAAALFRVCTRDYVLEDGRRIEKGTRIVVPVSGIQRDPQFWGPEADRYVPDRFRPAALKYQASYRKEDDAAGLYHREDMEDSEVYEEGEATKKEGITKMTYLPFGVGPRMCIGQRFALLETKMAIAKVLDNFEISLGPSTKDPPRLDPGSILSEMVGGTWLKFNSIKQETQEK